MKKQTWKSIFLSLIAIFTLFLLGACGQQSVQKSYLQGISQEKKTDVRITIEHKGDKAISNQTTTTIYYKEAGDVYKRQALLFCLRCSWPCFLAIASSNNWEYISKPTESMKPD